MAAVLTIASVDNTTDQITITAHGRSTGDGPVAIYTAAGVIPGGLAGNTDYWVIKVDANTIKLATSSANALLGTAINITSNGSGTLLLLLGIPYRRATTYVAGVSEVKSADLNDAEDALEALWNWFTLQHQTLFPTARTFEIAAGDWALDTSGTSTYSSTTAKWSIAGTAGNGIFTGIRPQVGTVITGARLGFNRVAGTLTFKIQKAASGAGAWTDVVTGTDSSTSGAGFITVTCTETVVADTQYRLHVESTGAASSDVASYSTSNP